MVFFVKILATVIIVGSGTYSSEWLKGHWLSGRNSVLVVVVISVIAALAIVLVDLTSDNLGRMLSNPSVTIHTSKQGNEIDLSIKIKGSVDRISLNYPVPGTVTNFQDLNPLTDARTIAAKVIGGTVSSSVQSNLQMTITDIREDAMLQYKIFYEPSQQSVQVAGVERYEVVYAWEYNAEKIQNTEWNTVGDDSVTTEPPVQVMGAQIFDRALNPEEIRRLYEAGSPQRNI